MRIWKKIAGLSSATILSQAIVTFSVVWLSRIYTPKDFGYFSLFTAVVSILSVLYTCRYEIGIVAARSDANNLAYLSYISIAIFGVFSGFALTPLIIFNVHPSYEAYIKIIAYGVPAAVLTSALSVSISLANKNKNYKAISIGRVLQSIITVVCSIIFGLLFDENGLIHGQLIALGLVGLYFMRCLNLPNLLKWNTLNYDDILDTAKKHKAYPFYMLPASMLEVSSSQLPVWLIGLWFSDADAGNYGMAWKVLCVPLSVVGSAVSMVFYQHFSDQILNPEKAMRFLVKSWRNLALVAIVPCAILFIFGESIFSIVLGDQWRFAGNIASILSPMLFFTFVFSPTSNTFQVLGLQRVSLIFVILGVVGRLGSICVGWFINDLIIGLVLFCVLEIANTILYHLVAYLQLRKLVIEHIRY